MEARIVVVKSPAAFRAAYADITQKAYLVDAPGASSANFDSLGFDRIQRPMYPFDDWNYII
jgi:microcystin degradation protein MlrC